jgi:hypothetical protein
VYFVGPPTTTAGGGVVAAKGRTGDGLAASDTGNDGLTPERPFSTIDGTAGAFAKAKSGRGDTICILPGTVTITAAIACDLDDITLTGIVASGSPIKPSSITSSLASSADAINITGANVIIEELHFPASTATTTSRIDCGAAGATIQNCTFECGAYDLETITIPAAGLHTTIRDNRFYVTANNPDAAIEIEAAGAHYIVITGNEFNGMNDTNGWDVGAINSGVAHLSCLVADNVNCFGPSIIFSAAATGIIARNLMGEVAVGSNLDPGSCMCFNNYEADAVDQSGRLIPTTVAS